VHAPYITQISYARWSVRSLFQTIVKQRKQSYHAVLFSSGVTHWKAWSFLMLCKAKQRIGEYRKYRLPGLTAYSKYNREFSRTQTNYNLFRCFLPLPAWDQILLRRAELHFFPQYYLTPANQLFADHYWQQQDLTNHLVIGIHPGCMAKNKFRRWPKEHFVDLINLLQTHYQCKILLIAGPDEVDVGEYLHEMTPSILLTNTSLSDVAAVISRCDFFINTDSGLGHIASCFGIKSLVIFGPANEKQTAPFSINSHIIRHQIGCAPCTHLPKQNCAVDCLRLLQPETVFQRVTELLS
jgi:heptosyltransferase-2